MTSTADRRFRAAGVGILVALLAGWTVLSVFAVLWQGTWADEAAYIIKSWWYISGAVKPYTAEDATLYPPLIFYIVGPWQWIVGHHDIGVGDGLLAFHRDDFGSRSTTVPEGLWRGTSTIIAVSTGASF